MRLKTARMKDRETAFRISEFCPPNKWPFKPCLLPFSLKPFCHSPSFLPDAPACSVGDGKCNSLYFICLGLQQEEKMIENSGFQEEPHLSSTVVPTCVPYFSINWQQ